MLKLFSGVSIWVITLTVNWDRNKIDIYVTQNKGKSDRDIKFIQVDQAVRIHACAVDLKRKRWG